MGFLLFDNGVLPLVEQYKQRKKCTKDENYVEIGFPQYINLDTFQSHFHTSRQAIE